MNEYILQCRDLSKKFSGRPALNGINMDILRGRIIGLLGPNGSGKTTFMKLANGLLVPSGGSILIDGHKPGPETKQAVSYLPDKDYLPDWMKVKDLVKMFTEFYKDFDHLKAQDMLQRLSINYGQRLKSI